MKKLHILLLQLPNPQFSLKKHWGNVPLAAGCLKAMAHKHSLLNEVEIEILAADSANLDTDSRLIEVLYGKEPDIIGFSLYVWNSARSLYLMKKLRQRLPQVKFIAGGPEVTKDNDFILEPGLIDIGCIGEGEITFVEIIKNLLNRKNDHRNVKGIFFRRQEEFVFTPPREPISDLNEIPSPYILGFLNPKDYDFGWIEASRGCPNKCEFCAWRDRPKGSFSSDRIIKELEVIKKSKVRHVKFLDADVVSVLRHDNLATKIQEINQARELQFFGFTSAERIDEKKTYLLKELNFTVLGIGLQSTNPQTLKNLGRKPNFDKFVRGCRLLMQEGMRLELEFIVGLPYDTLHDFQNIITFIKQNELLKGNLLSQFHLLLLPGTALRQKSAAYGIEYNKTPPYQIANSKYLPADDIQAAIRLNREGKRPAIFENMVTSYGTNIRHAGKLVDDPAELAGITRQISRIILVLDPLQQKPQELKQIGEKFNGIIRQPLIVWFRVKDIGKSLALIRAFLRPIIEKNPFILLNIFLETEKVFSSNDLDQITCLPVREKTITDNGIEKTVRVSVILPSHCEMAKSSPDLQALTEKIRLYRALKITPDLDWQNLPFDTKDGQLYSGSIIEFSRDCSENYKAAIIQFLSQQSSRIQNRVHFRETDLNFVLKALIQKGLLKPTHLETIVSFDKNLAIDAFFQPSPETNVDIITTQLRLKKRNSSV